MKVMVISTKRDWFPDLISPSPVYRSCAFCHIFWVCGLQIRCTRIFMLTPYLGKVVKPLVTFIGRSKSAPFSIRRTLYLAFLCLFSNMAVPLFIHWIPPWPNGLRPLSAPHVVWSANNGIVPTKISYRIPTSHPQQAPWCYFLVPSS